MRKRNWNSSDLVFIVTLAFIMVLFSMLLSCSKAEVKPVIPRGCQSAVNSKGERVNLRCCTEEEYQAGSVVSAGGIANYSDYYAHIWTPVSDCDKCK